MTTFVVRVQPGQEVVETVQEAVDGTAGLTNAFIVLIGAVDECSVSVMRRDDYSDDLVRHYRQPFELTGTGEVVDGTVHLHVSLGGEDLVVVGHLHRAQVNSFFVHAYITPLS